MIIAFHGRHSREHGLRPWIEWALLWMGILFLGYAALVYPDARLYQSYASRAFEVPAPHGLPL